jgi:hypothetical protein
MGFSWGNNFWIGSERSCLHLNNPPKITLRFSATRKMYANATDIQSLIPVAYRMFYLYHKSTIQFDIDFFNQTKVIHVGLCIPLACNSHDAGIFGEKILQPMTFNESSLYGNVKFMHTRTLKLRDNFWNEPFAKAML